MASADDLNCEITYILAQEGFDRSDLNPSFVDGGLLYDTSLVVFDTSDPTSLTLSFLTQTMPTVTTYLLLPDTICNLDNVTTRTCT